MEKKKMMMIEVVVFLGGLELGMSCHGLSPTLIT